MNADAIRRIIEGAKPMIKQRNEPAFDADLTRSRHPIPMPIPGDRKRRRAVAVVHAHRAGDPSTDHCLADLEPVAGHRHLIRRADRAVALLHLHGLREAALGIGVGGALASDPQPVSYTHLTLPTSDLV